MSGPLPIALPGGEQLRLLVRSDAHELHALIQANHAHLDRWEVHPGRIVTDTFSLDEASEAYRLADSGTADANT